jgi:hypothetical protein
MPPRWRSYINVAGSGADDLHVLAEALFTSSVFEGLEESYSKL